MSKITDIQKRYAVVNDEKGICVGSTISPTRSGAITKACGASNRKEFWAAGRDAGYRTALVTISWEARK